MRFETKKNLDREQLCVSSLSKKYLFDYIKLDDWDIDFLLTKEGEEIAYLEVKGRHKNIADAFPLPLAVKKLTKLKKKGLKSLVAWACNDGILLGNVDDLKGETKMGGRKPREGSFNDRELMCYYDDQALVLVPYMPL